MSELEQLKAENRQLLADVIFEQQKRLEDLKKYKELKQAFLDGLEFSYWTYDLRDRTGMSVERAEEIQKLYVELSKK